MTNYPPPTKAEILLTRGCDEHCSYCAMREYDATGTDDKAWKEHRELTAAQWAKVPTKLAELKVPFAPIYGAEPMTRMRALTRFIEGCVEQDIATTVITNGSFINDKTIGQLVDAGLTSITMSHDIVPANATLARKTGHADRLVTKLKNRFEDVAVVVTVNRLNYTKLIDFIEKMSAKNVWTCLDIVHPDRGQPGSKCKGDARKLTFEPEDINPLALTMLGVAKLKEESKKILVHPPLEYFDLYQDTEDVERYALNYGWKCRSGPWITIDSDGSVFGCDDYQPESFRKTFNILNYSSSPKSRTWQWEEFVDQWRYELRKCPGCLWSTHVASDVWWNAEGWLEAQTHGRVK